MFPPRKPLRLIVIGASAGGLQVLLRLLSTLPASYSLPLAVVLHLPDDRTSRLAELFQARLALRVREAEDKDAILPGTLYFAPPGYHLLVEDDFTLSLSRDEPVQFSRPSIDVLFESATDALGEQVCGILLTGANHDGASGLHALAQNGGVTVVQSPQSAEVPTMPEAALKRLHPDFVLDVPGIHLLLIELERDHG
ncbi:chemotaxis protein CheB [Pseudomonas oryzihabitans]|uniref:chemotaxis protein CheB n=1 Tax=Pseudomonas oryzihabitans TaxID=47885 RepID=UPI000ED54515|nr:chemotaxis protein CheB [Pseudomonas oryzihabitans]HCV75753.1 chemotaxis protein CheB [Pseudomonas sp.]